MEPAAFIILAGVVIQAVGAFAALEGATYVTPRKGWFTQYRWMRKCFRGEVGPKEQKLFRKTLVFGGLGWLLIVVGFVLA